MELRGQLDFTELSAFHVQNLQWLLVGHYIEHIYIFIKLVTISFSDFMESSQLAGFLLYTKGPIKF